MTARAGRGAVRLVLLLAVLAGVLVPAGTASAAGSVGIDVVGRPGSGAVADPTYLTELQLSGSGFQGVRNGFGGIYVFFGTVDGSWRPSQGGTTGVNYRYVRDDESNPAGFQLFIAFEGSSTGYAANGGTVDSASGTWNAVLKVPGATFPAYDRAGNVSTVDCRQVQCGIITIGAHGVVNATNESFTPVRFENLYGGEAAPPAAGAATAASTTAEDASPSAGEAVPEQTGEAGQAVVATPTTATTPAPASSAPATPALADAASDTSGSTAALAAVVTLGALLVLGLALVVRSVVVARRSATAAPPGPG